jgi:hypothetical protein
MASGGLVWAGWVVLGLVGAGGGQGLVGLALGGGGLAVEGGFVAGDDDGVVGVGVQAVKPRSARAPNPTRRHR